MELVGSNQMIKACIVAAATGKMCAKLQPFIVVIFDCLLLCDLYSPNIQVQFPIGQLCVIPRDPQPVVAASGTTAMIRTSGPRVGRGGRCVGIDDNVSACAPTTDCVINTLKV